MKEVTFLKAINEAVDEEMERDPRVFILGEDVGKQGGGVWVNSWVYLISMELKG